MLDSLSFPERCLGIIRREREREREREKERERKGEKSNRLRI